MKALKISLIFIILTLMLARLALPYFLLDYVTKQINKIPEYRVKIADLDVHLYRGSYTLHELQLWKITKKIPVPYFSAEIIDFSIEWKSLLHGKLVAKIVTQKPILNFVTDSKKNEQLTISSQWIDIVKSLYPLNINRFDAHNGEVYFRSYRGNPPFSIYMKKVEFTIKNMQDAEGNHKLLSSYFNLTSTPIGGGDIKIQGRFDPFTKVPTFDMNAKLNSLSVKNIANLIKHYTHVDVVGGTFSLYAEAAAAKGVIKGYAKPFLKNLKIGESKNNSSPITVVMNGIANAAAKILENPKQKTIATVIKISGNIEDPSISIWSIMGYLLHHAFINALLPQIDNTIDIKNVYYGNQKIIPQPSRGKHYPAYNE